MSSKDTTPELVQGTAANGGYYGNLANEYRAIRAGVELKGLSSESEQSGPDVTEPGKVKKAKERQKDKEKDNLKEVYATGTQELVPDSTDLYG